MMKISPEVAEALSAHRPVVALESTIISHGMPHPSNVAMALEVEAIVREEGAIPATIAVLAGEICVGLNRAQIEAIGGPDARQNVMKLSRRDLPFAVAAKKDGATTVSATMICAERAGIRVFATGGIGGVHRHGEQTMDVSADLQELAQTSVAVVCAGAKAILDIGRTLEVLETLGVPVVGYMTSKFPAFYYADSGFGVDCELRSPGEVASLLKAKWDLGLRGGVLVANPVPEADALDHTYIEGVIAEALQEAQRMGITGKDTTPFLLAKVSERTKGLSLKCNIALVQNNARVAAQIARAYAEMS
jgi:pseudouridine-5'-phosphate glycosidase